MQRSVNVILFSGSLYATMLPPLCFTVPYTNRESETRSLAALGCKEWLDDLQSDGFIHATTGVAYRPYPRHWHALAQMAAKLSDASI